MRHQQEYDLPGIGQSLWLATTGETHYPPLEKDIAVDVLVIGAGIAGLSTAYNLQQEGFKVSVIEARMIAQGVSGNTTAKVTSQHNLIYATLCKQKGEEKAKLYGQANEWALEEIARLSELHNIECNFTRAPAYVYTENQEKISPIEQEVKTAQRLGLPAEFTTNTELPFKVAAAIRFNNQAHFHPRKYLLGLAHILHQRGVQIFENTRALGIENESLCVIETPNGNITARQVVIATHQPFLLRGLYFTLLHTNSSYALAVRLKKDHYMQGMYISSSKSKIRSFRPYFSEEGSCLILGGTNHATGSNEDTTHCYKALADDASKYYDVDKFLYRWSAEDAISLDGVPLIGNLTRRHPTIFVATGFNKWGITSGVIAGMIVKDLILEKDNPYLAVFDSCRHQVLPHSLSFTLNNLKVAKDFIGDHLSLPPSIKNEQPAKGSGKILRKGMKKIAAYCDENGTLHCFSAICPHLGCVVRWNKAEKTWDCPCHGSRFDCQGKVFEGPAVNDLTPVEEE